MPDPGVFRCKRQSGSLRPDVPLGTTKPASRMTSAAKIMLLDDAEGNADQLFRLASVGAWEAAVDVERNSWSNSRNRPCCILVQICPARAKGSAGRQQHRQECCLQHAVSSETEVVKVHCRVDHQHLAEVERFLFVIELADKKRPGCRQAITRQNRNRTSISFSSAQSVCMTR